MPPSFLHRVTRLPSVVRHLVGAVLVLLSAMSALVSGATLMSDGPWWSAAALASGALLLVAAWRNWPMLWNALGQLLRALLGERPARAAFAAIAVSFMLPGAAGTALGYLDHRAEQEAKAPDGDFPLGITDTAAVEIRFGRGACFGTCPTYGLVVRGDGSVRFEGGDHVDSLSPAPARLGRAQLVALLQAFERVDFLSLGDYSASACGDVTDASSVSIALRFDGREKRVEHYRGCARAPEALSRLEWRIDSIVGVERWVGAGAARDVASQR